MQSKGHLLTCSEVQLLIYSRPISYHTKAAFNINKPAKDITQRYKVYNQMKKRSSKAPKYMCAIVYKWEKYQNKWVKKHIRCLPTGHVGSLQFEYGAICHVAQHCIKKPWRLVFLEFDTPVYMIALLYTLNLCIYYTRRLHSTINNITAWHTKTNCTTRLCKNIHHQSILASVSNTPASPLLVVTESCILCKSAQIA